MDLLFHTRQFLIGKTLAISEMGGRVCENPEESIVIL